MRYRLSVPDETADFLRSLHPEIIRKIKAALNLIVSDPGVGKSLRDELRGLKSFQIGRFRIIYKVASKRIVEIVAIGPRRTIYEETYRLLKKPPAAGSWVRTCNRGHQIITSAVPARNLEIARGGRTEPTNGNLAGSEKNGLEPHFHP